MPYKPKSTTQRCSDRQADTRADEKRVSPRRRRTLKEAKALLDRELSLRPDARRQALKRVHRAKQPNIEARRIIRQHQYLDLGRKGNEEFDLLDPQELRKKYLRHHGCIDSPQRMLLEWIEAEIVEGCRSNAEIKSMAAELLRMPLVLPKGLVESERNLLIELGGAACTANS